MSGVFSIASHSVLQYFPPEVTLQEQTGWAHFLLSSDAIWCLLLLNQPKGCMCASKERRRLPSEFSPTVGYSNSSQAVEAFAYIHSPLFGQDTAL
jgi:hypothetical protein